MQHLDFSIMKQEVRVHAKISSIWHELSKYLPASLRSHKSLIKFITFERFISIIMTTLLFIRFRQGLRYAAELGFLRGIVALFLLLFFYVSALQRFPPWLTAGIMAALLLSIHTTRLDKTFLSILGLPATLVYFVEYLLLALPFMVPLSLQNHWQPALSLFGITLVLPLLNVRLTDTSRRFSWVVTWLPAAMFEWKSGLRKHFFPLLIIYAIALFCYQFTVTTPIALLLLTLISCDFYVETESREMLEAFEMPPGKFLWFKLKNQLKIFWLLCLPLLLIFIFFHGAYWYVLPVVMLLCSVLQVLSILLKYAVYSPHEDLQGNFLLIGLSIIFFFVPFLLPLPFLWIVKYYRKAMHNLHFYLHDYA